MPRRPRLHTANYPHHITNEDNLLEPARVRQGGAEAKFWLEPHVRLARNDGFNAPTLRRIAALVQSHQVTFRRAWDEYFTDHGSFR